MSEGRTVNIATALVRMARDRPDALAIACPRGRRGPAHYRRWTYAELNQASDEIARGLEATGVTRGTRTALMVRPSLDLFALAFALFKVGAVPVFIDPGIGRHHLKTCLDEAEPEAFIGIPAAQLARLLFGWAKETIHTVITVGVQLGWSGTTLAKVRALGQADEPFEMAATAEDETAAILFTSGSTGVPKGAVYRHGNFVAQVEAIRALYGIEPGEVDLPTFPLFALFDPALGMTTIIPDMNPTRPARVNPRKILPAMKYFGVTNMFGSPALLDTVGRYGEAHGTKIPTLRRVISAGAPVPLDVMERFLGMLERGARVVTPYGATESLPVASISSHDLLGLGDLRERTEAGEGVCVGTPLPNVDVTVIHITDEPIPSWDGVERLLRGQVGEIVVRSPMTTQSYYNRPGCTELAKIPLAGGSVQHRMGDLGFVDKDGLLWFCGRKSQRVVTSKGILYTVPCELVFHAHKQVRRAALVGVPRNGDVVPVICVELERGARADKAGLKVGLRKLAKTQPHTESIETFLIHPGFPVDIRHNAKIRRGELAVWAEGKLS